MYTVLRRLSRQEILRQLPAFGMAFVLASAFYRFHNFGLECLAFLGTWYVLDAGLALGWRRLERPAQPAVSSKASPRS